jgi:surface protein
MGFIYIISNTDLASAGVYVYPIINTDNSFSGLSSGIVDNLDGTSKVTWSWTSFTDNGTTNDGLLFNNVNCQLGNFASVNITDFGGINLSRNSDSSFGGFSGQITATNVPVILNSTTASNLFINSTCSNFGNIGNWVTTNITNMGGMFYGCSNFNQTINSWDVSNVTNMNAMFRGCTSFNQSLNSWDVSSVTIMYSMFGYCYNFNQPLNSWNVSNVTEMHYMFWGCYSFNQDINSWNVSNVTDMPGLFYDCAVFNQPLNSWNVSKVYNMAEMFRNCYNFNQPLNSWNVSTVYNMTGMFYGCSNFNNPLNLWDVSRVENSMSEMFSGCSNFNQDISSWNVLRSGSMSGMFRDCTSFSYPNIGLWNFGAVYNMDNFITNATGLTPALYGQFLINLSNNLTLPNDLSLGTNGLVRYDTQTVNNAYNYLTSPTPGGKNMTIVDTVIPSPPPCFLEGTKILCFDNGSKLEKYIPIQDLRTGDLIKTYKHDYIPINMIGFSQIYNSGDDDRIKDRLYTCSSNFYPDLFEDLVITGAHSILVDSFQGNQREKTREILTRIFITDDKYRLPACVDNKTIPYDKEGYFTIYHIALDNDNYFGNYGVYANGLLVETCSKRYLKEISNMILL